MKSSRKNVFFACTLLPFAVWLIYFFISGTFALLGADGVFLTAFIIYCAVSVLSIYLGIIKYKGNVGAMSGKEALALTLINFGALVFILCTTYAAGYDFTPSPCAVLLCAGSVGVLYYSVLTASKKENMTAERLKKQLSLCVLLPLAAALFLNFNLENISDTVLMSAGAALLAAAVCFLIIYALAPLKSSENDASEDAEKYKQSFYKFCNNTALIAIFAIILPQICLWLNLGCENFLGNYGSPAFFIIAFINGILMLPAVRKKFLSLPYLYLKCLCFALIAYFTIAFIPVLPLGLFGIFFMGLGLLIFVPLFVFIMELGQIYYESRELKAKWKTGALLTVIILGIATLPAIFTANAAFDRFNLNNAIKYLNPYTRTYPPVDTRRLLGTIEKTDKTNYPAPFIRNFFENGTPFIDGAYREIVLDGAYLTENTKSKLDVVFNPNYFENYRANEEIDPLSDAEREDDRVVLRSADTNTYYDEHAQAWATDVTLVIKNYSERAMREYSADFNLPEGCIISDFWLDIDGERREGLITDKRAAVMTYDNVVRRMQDPAVIFYKDKNELQLNVFPFDKNEARACGFTVLHSDYEELEIDNKTIVLEPEIPEPQITEFDGGALIPAELISKFPEADRKPYYCFAVDMSADSRAEDLIVRLKEYIAAGNITDGTVYFASEKVTPVPLSELENIKTENGAVYIDDKIITQSGGYNLAGAFGAAQVDTLKMKDEYYPVLIAVTAYEKFGARILSENDFMPELPELSEYYVLTLYGSADSLGSYSAENNADLGYVNGIIPRRAVSTPYGIAADNGKTQIIYNSDIKPKNKCLYSDALSLYARSLDEPYDISNVRDSIYMNVLCPSTAFSVFETDEQISELMNTQKKILSGEHTLPTSTANTISMDEGSDAIFITAAAVIIAAAVYKRKKAKKAKSKSKHRLSGG